jgi:hypothetical protein
MHEVYVWNSKLDNNTAMHIMTQYIDARTYWTCPCPCLQDQSFELDQWYINISNSTTLRCRCHVCGLILWDSLLNVACFMRMISCCSDILRA